MSASNEMTDNQKVSAGFTFIWTIVCFIFVWMLVQKFSPTININVRADKVGVNLIILASFFIAYTVSMALTPDWWHFPVAPTRSTSNPNQLDVGTAVSNSSYFCVVVHSTTGFGDIYPLHQVARALVVLHVALVILCNFA